MDEHHRVGAFLLVNALGNLAAVLRIGLGMPKYPLWGGMAVLTHLARPTLADAPCVYIMRVASVHTL